MDDATPGETWQGRKRLLNRLRMRQVSLLLALKEGRTLSAAAAEIGVTQPAATKLLHELESALGCALFDRSGRQLRVNAAGRLAMGQFEAVRGAIEALGRSLQAEGEDRGTLVIGSIIVATSHLVAPAASAMRATLPGWTVRLTLDNTENLVAAVARGDIDIAIGRSTVRFPQSEYAYRELASDTLVIVASPGHRLAGRRRVMWGDLRAESWILPTSDRAIRQLVDAEFRRVYQDLPPALIETPSIYAMACLLAVGEHVAAMPLAAAQFLGQHGMLSVLPLKLQNGESAYGTIVSRRRPLPAAGERFLGLIHAMALDDSLLQAASKRRPGPA